MLQLLTNRRLRKAGEFWCYAADRVLSELRYEIASDTLKAMRREDCEKYRRWVNFYKPYQKITLDHDIKEIKRAIVCKAPSLVLGKARTVETGPMCNLCGQSGLAYRQGEQTRILVCSHIERSLKEFMRQRYDEHYTHTPNLVKPECATYGPVVIAGCPIESIECGRNLKMHLRMRFCWFD
jgi:hypothetical protein